MRGLRVWTSCSLVAATALLPATLSAARAATGPAAWSPQVATFGEGTKLDQPVTAADGTVLRSDEYFPTDPATGKAAGGPFPVLLQQTPYGKANIPAGSAIANTNVAYLVDRGYIVVISDVRGTGDSGGSFGLFDPVQGTDGATLVNWASRLPDTDGKVGLFGESYMGINQFLTVGSLPASSPVKAMFPIISGNDLYRDAVTQGGLTDAEFSAAYLALVAGLDQVNPLSNPSSNLLPVEAQHAGALAGYDLATVDNVESGGDQAYDSSYWATRNPVNILQKVVDDGIPAFLVGGWNDLFQRGELLNYTGLQNAFRGRPVLAPMAAGQAVTPRYQLMMGPWQHVTTGMGADLARVELEWFDTWLLGQDTPLAHSTDPLHLYQLNGGTWFDAAQWPLPQAPATRYYFGAGPAASGAASTNDGTLSTARPASAAGSDPIVFTGLSSVCDLQTGQWGAGALALAASSLHTTDPCETNDLTLGSGPGALTYTTAPLTQPQVLGGPIDATIDATSTAADTELVATVEEVSPSGQSLPLTSGALLGSLRAETAANTWMGADGAPILPYHPYTAASRAPVVPGQVTRYDIEVFPTFALIPAGWRLRVTITTSDTPHLAPTLVQLPGLIGGVYAVQRNAAAASFVNLPLAPAPALVAGCGSLCAGP